MQPNTACGVQLIILARGTTELYHTHPFARDCGCVYVVQTTQQANNKLQLCEAITFATFKRDSGNNIREHRVSQPIEARQRIRCCVLYQNKRRSIVSQHVKNLHIRPEREAAGCISTYCVRHLKP